MADKCIQMLTDDTDNQNKSQVLMLKQSSKKYIHTEKSPQTKPGLTHTISLPAFWQRPYSCKIPPRSPGGNILQQNDIIPIGGKGRRVP